MTLSRECDMGNLIKPVDCTSTMNVNLSLIYNCFLECAKRFAIFLHVILSAERERCIDSLPITMEINV